MPNKVNHMTVNERKLAYLACKKNGLCTTCAKSKRVLVGDFEGLAKKWQAHSCKRCWLIINWHNIKRRVNILYKTNPRKYGCYKNIELKITKKDYVEWGLKSLPDNLKQPSIDRIDSNGHYEFGNIRWIEFRDNYAPLQKGLPENKKKCSHCAETLDRTESNWFYHKKHKTWGEIQPCKKCQKKRYKKLKDEGYYEKYNLRLKVNQLHAR